MAKKKADDDVISGTPADDLADENAALKAREGQMLDMLIELREKVDALESGATAAPVKTGMSKEEAALNAELAGLVEEFKDYPLIGVFEQRAMVGQDANTDIRLKGDPLVMDDPHAQQCHWKLRWMNFGKEGRASQASLEGYQKVRWDELQDEAMVATGSRIDDFVRKGDRGLEVLHKIPVKLFDHKKRRDAARTQGLLTSESQIRDHVANRVAGMAGAQGGNASQAGDFAHGIQMTITPQPTERITL